MKNFFIMMCFITVITACSSNAYLIINFAKADILENPSPDSNIVLTVYFLCKVEDGKEKKDDYRKIIVTNPYSGKKYTGWTEDRYLSDFKDISGILIETGKSYKTALSDCRKHYDDSCSTGCGSGGCDEDVLQLLEFGWKPTAEEWAENGELQMLIFDGRGPHTEKEFEPDFSGWKLII
ncbi:MAG: hypothetical protein JW982_14095 [Spirochaetes bacterium]|nr:hypothetical protein [Spirochaetota bacterium]